MHLELTIHYGPLRLRIAEWAEKDPADITLEDVHRYEALCAREGREP